MPDIALRALKQACERQVTWLQARAEGYEQGRCRHLEIENGQTRDRSQDVAEQFRHQAGNLQAVMDAYERLLAKGP